MLRRSLRLLNEVDSRTGTAFLKDGRERLVICGTGWASFRLLNDIDSSKYFVTVVSPRNHLLFTPMLPSSAVGTVNQRSICQPVRPVVAQKKARYYESRAEGVNVKEKKLNCVTSSGQQYSVPYDKLVVGVGFQPNDFGIPGVKEHALFMKETKDATVFKDHVLEKLEEASYYHALDSNENVSEEEQAKITELLTFVIVGGGPTGVELAGELTDFLQAEGVQQYGHLKPYMSVHMLTYDLLNVFDKSLQDYAIRHLRKKQGVNIHMESFVQKVEKDSVTFKKAVEGKEELQTIRYGTLVWCAGIKPHAFVRDFGFPMNDRNTQILTDGTLRVKGLQDVYAIGDCATIEDYWLPQTAQVAKQQAVYLAREFNRGTAGKSTQPFVFKSLGMMANLGGYTGLMTGIPGMANLSGFLAFLGWRSVYWSLQLSFRNRFMLSTDWLRTLIFGRDLTRFGPPSVPQ